MDAASPAILIVDDDPVVVELVRVNLKAEGFANIEICTDSTEAMDVIRARPIAVVLLDLYMPKVTGFEILEDVVQEFPRVPVIVLTSADTVEAAVRCMKIGAFDFLNKPVDRNRLVSAINHALRVRELEQRLSLFSLDAETPAAPRKPHVFEPIITRSSKMHAVFEYIEAIAPSPKAVLITGESGTGKELIARAVHDASARPGRFVAVNVAGLDDAMFSDTLFGHTRGAFTGAERKRSGLVERAEDGTLFLDEIGDLDPPSQIKLLRLLQDGEFYPLGADEPVRAKVRIVAATNVDLREQQERGTFRRDLYYRLIAHLVQLPPLRERREDIPILLQHFVRETAQAMGFDMPRIPDSCVEILQHYRFPGNIRELQSIVADAVSQARNGELPLDVLQHYLERHHAEESSGTSIPAERFSWNGAFPTLDEVEDFFVDEALRLSEGNQSAAARLLGVSQSTISRRLQRKPMQSA